MMRCATRGCRNGRSHPNDTYAALVAAAGYLPVTLSGEDYLELLPVTWRDINDYGIRIGYRTYDCHRIRAVSPQPSGVTARSRALGGALRPL